MELSTSSISNEIDKSIKEDFSVSQAAIDEIKLRKERGEKPESISNEEIKKGDPILDTYKVLDDAMHGGMGSVWRVHHESWNVDLAMKRPQPRFFAEGSEARSAPSPGFLPRAVKHEKKNSSGNARTGLISVCTRILSPVTMSEK